MCSCQEAGIDLSNFVVVVGQLDFIPLIEDLGAHAMHSHAFGPIPKNAASNYGDLIFSRLMWLKATSMYVASAAGFNVLFQVRCGHCCVDVFRIIGYIVMIISVCTVIGSYRYGLLLDIVIS